MLFGQHTRAKHGSLRAIVTRNIEKNLPGTILAVCFIPRMRLWGPIVSGSLRIRYQKFITYDAIGVALFVLIYTNLGYFFGVSLSTLFAELRAMQASIFVIILLILGAALAFVANKAGEWNDVQH